jgi:hypothetical protein
VSARAALEAARSDVAVPPPTPAQVARIGQARRAVARICLGEGAAAPAASRRMAQAPLAAAAVPAAPAPGLPAPQPTTVQRAEPPAVLTACDALGCWDSQGRRLERAGPLLLGPQGPCTAQGGRLNCP